MITEPSRTFMFIGVAICAGALVGLIGSLVALALCILIAFGYGT